jgi:Molybdopterin biosynthesis enzyme
MERKSYVENNDYYCAVSEYLQHFTTLGSETIAAENASGRVTAKAIYATVCDPVYNASAMDGIAVFAENTMTASDKNPLVLNKDKDFVYVNTGNIVPPEFDSVIMIEDVLVDSDESVRIIAPSSPWQNVRVIGESVVATEMILPSFRRIRPIDIGALLAGGNDEIEVIKKPRVGIIPTGNEMVESAAELKIGKLRESNTRVFVALTESYGAIPMRYDICEDSETKLEDALKKAIAENDMVVVNAGSSAGTKDFTVHIIARLGKVYTHGLAVKPGKPTILGEIDGKPVIGVPGYPVSAYIIYERVVRQVITKLAGVYAEFPTVVTAEITKRTTSTLKHEEFLRVAMGDVGGKIVATPLERGAAAVMSMVKADGIVTIPRNSEGIEVGEKLRVELLKPLSEIRKSLVIVGSHDMIIDVIGDSIPVSSAHVGSLSGIMAMKNDACNIAPIHLLDEVSGVYNEAYVRKYFEKGTMALVKGVGRVQGILVEKGNPKNIKSVNDIKGGKISFANRQGGAGTRILFDYLLKKNGVSSDEIRGYDKEFTTHLAVATAVKNKAFDCGLAVKTAAIIMDLDFIPVGNEEYDFWSRKTF